MLASRGLSFATNAVGRKTGVPDAVGVAIGDGVADTDATRGEAMVVATGLTVPASNAEAVGLGDATAACP